MSHIEKILLNNARRFGEEVKVDFGEGATIILAPNGTGKTTIFEAIEFALTGGITRIDSSLDAIIRDGSSKMDVRLNFSDGKYCQANLSKGGNGILTGNHKELFGAENNLSLPYLFRLTHFLEQRGKNWVVEQDDKKAGNLLSKLPIGKDLQEVLSKKTSLLKAIGKLELELKNDISSAEKILIEFEQLIDKKKDITVKVALTPLEEIVSELLPISRLLDYKEYNEQYEQMKVNAYFEKIKIALKQEITNKKEFLVKLSALKERSQTYVSNIKTLEKKEKLTDDYLEKIEVLNYGIEKIKEEIKESKNNLDSIKVEIEKLNLIKEMIEELAKKIENIKARNLELEKNKIEMSESENAYKKLSKKLEKIETTRDTHKLINNEIENEKALLIEIEQKSKIQKQWQEVVNINKNIIEKEIPKLEEKKNKSIEEKRLIEIEKFEANKLYLVKKETLISLNNAFGAIQEAVSSIRINLSEDQKICPVCQATYEHDELIKRIESSMNALNPRIPQAIEEERAAAEFLGGITKKQQMIDENILSIQSALDIDYRDINSNIKKISEDFLPQFIGLNSPEDAKSYIEEKMKKTITRINELELSRVQLEPEESIEEINRISLEKNVLERLVNDVSNKTKNILNEITDESIKIEKLNQDLGNQEKESVLENLRNLLINYDKAEYLLKDLQKKMLENEVEIKGIQDNLFRENELISKIKSSQDSIFSEWSQLDLEGYPNIEILENRTNETLLYIDELEKLYPKLNTLEQELTSWRNLEKFTEIDNEIKRQIGKYSERDYLDVLKEKVNNSKIKESKINERIKAVNLFLTSITKESENLNDQLDSINEPWQRLLKRIVINPLISSAPLLRNTTLRNQPKATISASIHNQKIDIAKIASEAQLTDLQLTLMLAMANKYQWTPWKALLLDDPTQHHDLVHASSVFDVLRDYIIDLNYQVMMSTHDSIQAKFFHRKLENEGIPSKIYQLVSRKGGVTAERIE